MKRMAAAQFKARCLRVMDQVRIRREPVLITKKGVAVAKLVPVEAPRVGVFGCMAGTADIVGDLEAPVLPAKAWKAVR